MADSRTTIKTTEITTGADTLQIRGSWSGVLLGLSFGGVFLAVGLMLPYAFTGPSTGWHGPFETPGPMLPFSQHTIGDQVATGAFSVFICGIFAGPGAITMVYPVYRRLFPWRFDRRTGELRRGNRHWNLSTINGVWLRTDRPLGAEISVSIMLDLNTGRHLRLLRNVIAKHETALGCLSDFEPVARDIAEWLNVPMRAD